MLAAFHMCDYFRINKTTIQMSAVKDLFQNNFLLSSLRILLRTCYVAILPVFGSCNIADEGAAPEDERIPTCQSILPVPRTTSSSLTYNCLDIFIYNYPGGDLDTYSHQESIGPNVVLLNSSEGRKRAVLVANAPKDFFSYSDIVLYSGLDKVMMDFAKDDPQTPMMSAELLFDAPASLPDPVILQPVMSKVTLQILEVNFDNRFYADKKLEDPRIYITNASTLCPINSFTSYKTRGLMNVGGLDSLSVSRMRRPDMVFKRGLDIYARGRSINQSLYCYPRSDADSSVLGPTRIVLDGLIDGVRYYYPIDIGGGKVERGFNYILDIWITRAGSISADVPCSLDAMNFTMTKTDWNEYEEEIVTF